MSRAEKDRLVHRCECVSDLSWSLGHEYNTEATTLHWYVLSVQTQKNERIKSLEIYMI